jgi:DNA-binding NtrC family response regulator
VVNRAGRRAEPADVADVLVLDDDAAIARYTSMALALEGHRVRTELNVAAAANALRGARADVLVLDVRVGIADGLEWLGALRAQGRAAGTMQVVLHTSEPWERIGHRASVLGVFEVVAKPSDPDELARAVARAAAVAELLAA